MKSFIKLKRDYAAWRRASGPGRGSAANFEQSNQRGFSLLEATIALLLMTVVALGSASLFFYSVYNNSGGSDRATSLAIAQQQLERLRSAQFNQTTTAFSLGGGTSVQNSIVVGQRTFRMTVQIDDDPLTDGVQVNPTTNLKTLTVTVVPQSILRGWAFGVGGTITLITQRSRTDR